MSAWDDDDDEILRAPRRGKPYDPIATMRGEMAVMIEDIEQIDRRLASIETHWKATRAFFLAILGALLSLATWSVYTTITNQRDVAEQARIMSRHDDLPVHTRTPEAVSGIREAMGEIKVELREWRQSNDARLGNIEKRLEKRR